MNIIVWLVVGGLVGWVAGRLMGGSKGIVMNVVVGVVGAFLGGWLLGPMLGASTINQGDFSLASLAVSVIGAVILLAMANLLRRATSN
jgi:uncharacterized membrane protein YeaQ/YmgE (transglycosylase-associated protein family)